MKKVIFFIGLSLVLGCSTSKKVPQRTAQRQPSRISSQSVLKEVSSKPAVIAVKSRFLLKDSSIVRVFLEMEVERLPAENFFEKFRDNFRINWLVVPDFGIKDRLASGRAEITKENCFMKDGRVQLTFDIPRVKNQKTGLLLTEITEEDSGKKATNDLTIDFNGTHLNDRFGMFVKDKNIPIFRNFVNQKDTFELRSLNNLPKDFFLIRYQHEFEAAASPMSTSPRPSVSKSLKVDSVMKVATNTPISLDEGLYLVTDDTTTTKNGFGFMIVDNRYPRLTRPEKLTKPLLYMSTNTEIQNLNTNKDGKQALDTYFLTMAGGNQAVAKRIIKAYYHRVEEANRLFSSYKEGWKTDKGMIYIVLGPPNRVQRSKDREVWVYSQNQNFSEIIFTFYRKPNQFTENHYELLRYPEYQAYWYPFVEAWRTGNVSE